MKLVNASHLKKHLSNQEIDSLLRKVERMYGTSTYSSVIKMERLNRVRFTNRRIRHIDIEQAIAIHSNSDEVVKQLKLVFMDRRKYGDSIPDTSDTWVADVPKHIITQKTEKQLRKEKNQIVIKLLRREEFLTKWDNINW